MDWIQETPKALQGPAWDPIRILLFAIRYDDTGLVQKTLNENNPNLQQLDGADSHSCPLCYAVYYGRVDIVRMLIAAGAAINVPRFFHHERGKWTPIQMAIWLGRDIVKLLWDAGASPIGGPGESVLELAAECGQRDTVEDVLAWWKDCPLDRKKSALCIAASRREPYIVRRLLQEATYSANTLGVALLAAADERIQLDEWESLPSTPEDMAAQHDTIEVLLDAGAEVDFRLGDEPRVLEVSTAGTAVYLAAGQFYGTEGLKLLLARGADPNSTSWYQSTPTPLHAATEPMADANHRQVIHEEGIKALLKHGALPTGTKNGKGDYPIHRLARWGNLDMLQLCLAADGDPDMLNKHRGSLLKAANDGKKPEIARFLTSHEPIPRARLRAALGMAAASRAYCTIASRVVVLGMRRRW